MGEIFALPGIFAGITIHVGGLWQTFSDIGSMFCYSNCLRQPVDTIFRACIHAFIHTHILAYVASKTCEVVIVLAVAFTVYGITDAHVQYTEAVDIASNLQGRVTVGGCFLFIKPDETGQESATNTTAVYETCTRHATNDIGCV